jgi:hypothetical protein
MAHVHLAMTVAVEVRVVVVKPRIMGTSLSSIAMRTVFHT